MENFFSGTSIEDNVPEYHRIVTDNPFMAEIGLSSMTTGTLYKWWYEKDEKGEYKNRKLVAGAEDDDTPQKILFGQSIPSDFDWMSFKAWRKESDNSGKYKQLKHSSWDFKQKGISYTRGQLSIDDFDDKRSVSFDYSDKSVKLESLKNPENKEVKGINPLTNIVALNDYMRMFSVGTDKKRKDWDKQEKARDEFVEDIKTSKYTCVSFSGEVEFNLSLADGAVECSHKEWIPYKLYLYDSRSPENPSRPGVLSSLKYAAPAVDSTGRTYSSREDGEIVAAPTDDSSKHKVGDLDVVYNQFTKKWESGSRQIVAKVTKTITTAMMPTVDKLEARDNAEVADTPEDKKNLIKFGQGEAMPITMQNGNPAQWSPDYANTKGCREDKKKVILKVFNPDDTRAFLRGALVYLNRIDGVWIATGFTAEEDPAAEQLEFEGKWEFTYFATNAEFFFKDVKGNRVSPRTVEKCFHRNYYSNSEPPTTPNSPYGAANSYNIREVNPYSWNLFTLDPLVLADGYHQFTSFDFMDKYVGGTRNETRSLATTQWNIDPLGFDEGQPGAEAEPTTSGPFFGCVFPDGYNDVKVQNYTTGGRDFDVHVADDVSDEIQVVNDYIWWLSEGRESIPFSDGEFVMQEYARVGGNIYTEPNFTRNDCISAFKKELKYFPTPATAGQLDGEEKVVVPMFAGVPAGYDSLLALPADIGTNASPSGTNGSPITNLHKIGRLYHKVIGTDLQAEVTQMLHKESRYIWLHKSAYVDGVEQHGKYVDAYDFKPANPNKLQFRPLKAEVYGMFDIQLDGGGFGYDITEFPVYGNFGLDSIRATFSGFTWDQMYSKECPASIKSYEREKRQSYLYGPNGTGNDILPTPYSLGRRINPDESQGAGYYGYNWGGQAGSNPWFFDKSTEILTGNSSLEQQGKSSNFPQGLRMTRADMGWQEITGGTLATDFWNAVRYGSPAWGMGMGNWAGHWMTFDTERNREDLPAGCVGVIGAVATAGSNGAFVFKTENYIGEGSWRLLTGGTYGTIPTYASWGGGDKKFSSFQTTDLSVTIYQAWPRKQTIYDPRFFAVHHFNPGIEFGFENDAWLIPNPAEREVVTIGDYKYQAPAGYGNVASTDVDYLVATYKPSAAVHEIYLQDIASPDGDDPVPMTVIPAPPGSTRVFSDGPWIKTDGSSASASSAAGGLFDEPPAGTATLWGDVINLEAHVKNTEWEHYHASYDPSHADYNDVPHPMLGNPVLAGEWMPTENWIVDTYRRGKLLPFYASSPALTLPSIHESEGRLNDKVWVSSEVYNSFLEGDRDTYFHSANHLDNEQRVAKIDFVWTSRGNGYVPGNLLTVDGYTDVVIKVLQVEEGGSVSKFQIIRWGRKFDAADFFSSDTLLTPSTEGSVKVVNTTSLPKEVTDGMMEGTVPEGVGFAGYFTQGDYDYAWTIDDKPKIATEQDYYQLSVLADNSDEGNNVNRIEVKEGNAKITVGITKPSADRRYDLFFHFHNDISHTRMGAVQQSAAALPFEQYIQLTIDPGTEITADATSNFATAPPAEVSPVIPFQPNVWSNLPIGGGLVPGSSPNNPHFPIR